MYEAFIGCAECSYGVMVSTLDFESSDPGSNPGRSSFLYGASSGGVGVAVWVCVVRQRCLKLCLGVS